MEHLSKRDRFTAILCAGLLLVILLLLPLLHYYFWNFYRASWEEYRKWYPHTFFIVFPLVKILPLAVLAILGWYVRKPIYQFFFSAMRWLALSYFGVLRWIAINYKNTLLSIIVFVLFLGISEFLLRKIGFEPGHLVYTPYFHPVDSLFLLDGFSTDSDGIFKVSGKAREFICDELKRKHCSYDLEPIGENQFPGIYSVAENFILLQGYRYKSEFKSFLSKLNSVSDTSDAGFYSAVRNYVECPINANGFRSIEFKKYNTRRKSLLLLGDSFTWGDLASNLTNSFADLLLAKGYVVYNTGIAGTDPAQYLQLAKKLIPELMPDYVVVNFYIGNDIMYFERTVQPYVPLLYCTNAGNLLACPDGIYFNSPQEAYRYTLAHFTIPKDDNRINYLFSKTALSTLLWSAITRAKPEWTMSGYKDYYQKIKAVKTKDPFSDKQLAAIKDITERHGGKFLLVAIPMYDGRKFIFPENYPRLFQGLDYHIPPVKKEYYENRRDGHYNDRGHAMHAAFIDSLVRNDE